MEALWKLPKTPKQKQLSSELREHFPWLRGQAPLFHLYSLKQDPGELNLISQSEVPMLDRSSLFAFPSSTIRFLDLQRTKREILHIPLLSHKLALAT